MTATTISQAEYRRECEAAFGRPLGSMELWAVSDAYHAEDGPRPVADVVAEMNGCYVRRRANRNA